MIRSSNINKKGSDYYVVQGFIPSNIKRESVSCTLEYAYDDWAISRMAGAMAGYADAITIRNAQKAIRKELETMLTAYVDAMQAEDPPEAAP